MNSVLFARSTSGGEISGMNSTTPSVTSPASDMHRTTPASAQMERRSPEESRAYIFYAIIGTDETVVKREDQKGNAKPFTELMLAYRGRMKEMLDILTPNDLIDIEREFDREWRRLTIAATRLADHVAGFGLQDQRQRSEADAAFFGEQIENSLRQLTALIKDRKIGVGSPAELQRRKEALFKFLDIIGKEIIRNLPEEPSRTV